MQEEVMAAATFWEGDFCRRVYMVHGTSVRSTSRRCVGCSRIHRWTEKRASIRKKVSAGWTGHAESVQILYDPTRSSDKRLLEVLLHNIDSTSRDRQFCDSEYQYRSAICYYNEEQRRITTGTITWKTRSATNFISTSVVAISGSRSYGSRRPVIDSRVILQCLPISWHESIRPCKLTVQYAMIS